MARVIPNNSSVRRRLLADGKGHVLHELSICFVDNVLLFTATHLCSA